MDGSPSPEATATIHVAAVNDAPQFTKGVDPEVLDNAGAQAVNGWATSISLGPPGESSQQGHFLVTSNNAYLSQPVPKNGGPLGPFCDVNGDGWVAPSDALDVINFINAMEHSGAGEASGQEPAVNSQALAGHTATAPDDWMTLLAIDVLGQGNGATRK